jgi:predicted nucleic acid-binding protein
VVYLEEKHKIRAGAAERIRQACETEGASLEIVTVDACVAYGIHGIARADVPDMPDRVIAATAVALGVPLVTRDEKILAAGVRTIRA